MDSFGSPSQDSFCSPREARMVLARPFLEKIVFHTRATAKLCQILLSVYNHPGIIKVHIIPDVKLRDKVVHTLPIKLFYYFLYRFGLFPAVDLYIQAIITSS